MKKSKAPWKIAKLKCKIFGSYSRWKKGETVRAMECDGNRFLIERLKWTGTKLPLQNQLAGVPADALRFLFVRSLVVEPLGGPVEEELSTEVIRSMLGNPAGCKELIKEGFNVGTYGRVVRIARKISARDSKLLSGGRDSKSGGAK